MDDYIRKEEENNQIFSGALPGWLFGWKYDIFSLMSGGGNPMKCYVCAKLGVDKDAVAICIVCGMGLCMGHAIKQELVVRDVVNWGLGEERIDYPLPLPRFVCAECRLAIDQRVHAKKA